MLPKRSIQWIPLPVVAFEKMRLLSIEPSSGDLESALPERLPVVHVQQAVLGRGDGRREEQGRQGADHLPFLHRRESIARHAPRSSNSATQGSTMK